VKQDFYAELPIKITLTGSYHDFGAFVSGIAALPRIVTLHDIQITPLEKTGGFDQLQLDVTAKTYRYLDDDEIAAAEAEKRKADQAKKHGAGS
jgi:type IV pilus assembly protein PilO